MKFSRIAVLIIGSCCAGVLVVILIIGINMLRFQSGSAVKSSPEDAASQESHLIATQVKTFIQDNGVPSDIKTLPSLLFGKNARQVVYLNADAFRTNSLGEICDAEGKPFSITIQNGIITVESTSYSVSAKETY